ncbi:nucleotidyltransferase domain-containing protein [Romeria aff. gracilis LEGE 07310]|uniref:Nucleotidyltransferase domain-containing protein n=1 Tax=Vasconcelosia minhoensis LEGE 07310 TaxID=915328 RepID=A0A8J7A7L3_9CYAN|nr:nucleotidyltransferase domain-containing protein [Romeria gracilis]MBE9078437.1 nucleotidyltransferase domain-containing protein [Romeria aff. gracilis LEGE 07310]
MGSSALTSQAMAIYRASAQRRSQSTQRQIIRRRQRAWLLAHQAADLLKQNFAAEKVAVFGSLLCPWFSLNSDIDLAVWGIAPQSDWSAVAQLQDIDSDFKIDLVDMSYCPDSLKAAIAQTGQVLS